MEMYAISYCLLHLFYSSILYKIREALGAVYMDMASME